MPVLKEYSEDGVLFWLNQRCLYVTTSSTEKCMDPGTMGWKHYSQWSFWLIYVSHFQNSGLCWDWGPYPWRKCPFSRRGVGKNRCYHICRRYWPCLAGKGRETVKASKPWGICVKCRWFTWLSISFPWVVNCDCEQTRVAMLAWEGYDY